MENSASFFRKVFRDISRGYSEIGFQGSPVFVKHLTNHDQVDLDDVYSKCYDHALSRGLPTEEEKLKQLIEDELWSETREKGLKTQIDFIEDLEKVKTNLILKSKIDKQNELIKVEQDRLQEMSQKRAQELGTTCESYSDNAVNEFYILKSLYKDKELKEDFYKEEDFFEIENDELGELIKTYNVFISRFAEIKIQETILQDFFYAYFPFCEDTVGFFGIPVCLLTNYQLKLIVFTRVFKNILENEKHIPEYIRKDPKALLDFGSMTEEARERVEKQKGESGEGGGVSLVGATKEDYEYLGLEPPSSDNTLSKALEEKGGSLSMQDMLEMQGLAPKKEK